MDISHYLNPASSDKGLTEVELEAVFSAMLSGKMTEAQTAGFLVAWKARGESSQHFIAGARCMRNAATKMEVKPSMRPILDTCGTGGDSSHSFNISTTAAIIAAAAGINVAKHGNRSVSSQCGSADLMFALGFPDILSAVSTSELLRETGFTFFFAPQFHPGMKHVMPVRKQLGIRTIFNFLGPLANPISPEFQVIGIGVQDKLRDYAEAAQKLGMSRALVVHSRDGMDEISCAAETDAILVTPEALQPMVIDPEALGLAGKAQDHQGGDVNTNQKIFGEIIQGKRPPAENAVVLNAAASLWIAGRATNMQEGAAIARKLLADGTVQSYFARVISRAIKLAGG